VYALGLEGMLSASHVAPLPHAMTDVIADEHRVEHAVTRSTVMLELENGAGDVVTLRRSVKSPTTDSRLITVYPGPGLTRRMPEPTTARDYFVKMEGAYERENGFPRFLAEFVGWQLPVVTRYNGSQCPLYMDTIFPLLLIEQKHGWSGV